MKRIANIVLAASCMMVASCDETRVREGATEFATLEESAMRVLVTPRGIGELVQVANPEGLPLDGEQVIIEDTEPTIAVGPLAQILPVSSRMSQPEAGAVTLTTRHDGATIFVPMRVTTDSETRICRWRFEADRIESTATIMLVEGADGREFGVTDDPVVTLENETITPITNCDPDGTLFDNTIESVLVDYVSGVISDSAARSLPTSPLDLLGLLRQNLQLARISPFENRTGTLILEGRASSRDDAASISPDGLSIIVDATADAQRARCSPPVALNPTTSGGAQVIEPELTQRFEADFALAMSSGWLSRLAQASILAGYGCRGMEDASPDVSNAMAIPVDELLLDEIGVDGLVTGNSGFIVLSPGSLPRFEFRQSNGTVNVTWSSIELDIYGEVFGARSHVATIVADIDIGVRPRAGAVGAGRFDIESITVTNVSVETEFGGTETETAEVERWTQRTLLLMLEETLEFPLPIQPEASVRVVGMQVRSDDIVAFLRFE